MVQGLGLWAFTAEGLGSIPGQGTEIPQATWRVPHHPPPAPKKRLTCKKLVRCVPWTELCPPPSSVEALTPRVTVFGGGASKEGMKVR